MSKRVNLRAIDFDGDNAVQSGIIVPDADNLSFTDGTKLSPGNDKPFSISFWMNIDRSQTNPGGFVAGKLNFDGIPDGSAVANRANEWFVRVDPTAASYKIGIFLYDAGKSNSGHQLRIGQDDDAAHIQTNTWHQLVFTYSGNPILPDDVNVTDTGLKIYVDGAEIAVNQSQRTGTAGTVKYENMANTDSQFSIGMFGEAFDEGADITAGDPQNNTRVFKGKLADICIFNKELTATEVTEVYNSGKVKDMTKFSAYNNIVSWWKMGDDQDHAGADGIRDYVGTNHGTMKFLERTTIINDPSLPTDRIATKNFVPTSWGRTRQPKSIAGDHQVYIHGGISGNMPTAAPSGGEAGYVTENQRYLHLYWKAASTTAAVTAWGYNHASGQWSELFDTNGTQVKLSVSGTAADTIRVFEISGVDRVYFQQSGTTLAATDLFAAAASSF